MPFRERQKLPYSCSAPVKLSHSEIDDYGNVTTKFVDASLELPPRETMRLGNLLKAGVPLQEVNGKLLGSDSVDLGSVSPKSKPNPEPKPNSAPEFEPKIVEKTDEAKE